METKKTELTLFGVIILFIILWSNTQFSYWPEMMLWPYLMLNHWLPYRDIAIAHSPYLPTLLSGIFALFGSSLLVLKIFSWAVVIFTALLVYIVAKKVLNPALALSSSLVYLVLEYRYEGNGLWFDILLAPSLLLTYLFLKQKKYFLTGVFLAISFFIKQTAFWFFIPFSIIFFLHKPTPRSISSLIFGALLVTFVTILAITLFDIFPHYLNWAIRFGIFILPKSTPKLVSGLIQLVSCLWPFLIGLLIPLSKAKNNRVIALELFSLSTFASFGAFPRWELFHFQPALPFLSLAIVCIIFSLSYKHLVSKVAISLYAGVFLIIFFLHFRNIWRAPDRFLEPEIASALLYTQAHTKPGDTIFVLNWWDSLYTITNRLPPKPWIPQLPQYLSVSNNEDILVSALVNDPPKMVLFKKYESNSYVPTKLVKYIYSHYHPEIEVNKQYEILIPN